jgi:hypothetical protein
VVRVWSIYFCLKVYVDYIIIFLIYLWPGGWSLKGSLQRTGNDPTPLGFFKTSARCARPGPIGWMAGFIVFWCPFGCLPRCAFTPPPA